MHGPRWQKRTRRLEVINDTESGLEIVLGLVEEGGVHPVDFTAHGKPGMQAVVEAEARLRGERVAAVARRLGLQVRAAHQSVCPGLEPVTPAANADSAATAEIFHMLVNVDGGSKAGDDVAFDGEPTARVVADRGVGADEAGVNEVRLEAVKLDAQA